MKMHRHIVAREHWLAPTTGQPLIFSLLVGIVVATASDATAATMYSIATVADNVSVGATPDGLSNGLQGFGFNNVGTAVFGVTLPSLQTRIYTGNGGPLGLVAADSNYLGGPTTYTVLDGSGASINDSGVVAFNMLTAVGTVSGTDGIYTSSGTTIYTASYTVGSGGYTTAQPMAPTAINNNGEVAFYTSNSVLTGNGGPLTTIASLGGSGFTYFAGAPSLNSGGTVEFPAETATGGGVYAGSGGALTTIWAGSNLADLAGSSSINSSGNVAVSVDSQILVGDGDPVIPPTASAAQESYPTINDSGQIAYLYGPLGSDEILVGSNPVDPASDAEVIRVGDALDGSTVSGFGPVIINNMGQVAFDADLADGDVGLFIATPVPEPSTLALAAAAAGALCLTRVRGAALTDKPKADNCRFCPKRGCGGSPALPAACGLRWVNEATRTFPTPTGLRPLLLTTTQPR